MLCFGRGGVLLFENIRLRRFGVNVGWNDLSDGLEFCFN